jgi:hypothetical protein
MKFIPVMDLACLQTVMGILRPVFLNHFCTNYLSCLHTVEVCGTCKNWLVISAHGRMNYKDTKPYMSAFLKNWTAALCLTDFIDWRYIHCVCIHCIFDPACELLPLWTKEQYLCTVAPLPYLLSDLPPPILNVLYIQTVCVTGEGGGMGGCWIVV